MNILLYQILVSTIHKNFKKSYYNNKFKASAPAWNNKVALPDGYLYLDEYSVSDIEDCFKHIIKKHEILSSLVHKIQNKITFKVKTAYHVELLIPRTMKLHGSVKSKINGDKNGKNVLHLARDY